MNPLQRASAFVTLLYHIVKNAKDLTERLMNRIGDLDISEKELLMCYDDLMSDVVEEFREYVLR